MRYTAVVSDLYQRDLAFFRNQGLLTEILIMKEQEWKMLAVGIRGEQGKVPRDNILGQV